MARKKQNKKKKLFRKNPLETLFEILILFILIPFFYYLSFFSFIGYCLAIIGIFYNGTIFRRKKVLRFIVLGSLLTYIAGVILVYGLNQNNNLSLILVVFLGILIWIKGFRMKKLKS